MNREQKTETTRTLKAELKKTRAKWKRLSDDLEEQYQWCAAMVNELTRRGVKVP